MSRPWTPLERPLWFLAAMLALSTLFLLLGLVACGGVTSSSTSPTPTGPPPPAGGATGTPNGGSGGTGGGGGNTAGPGGGTSGGGSSSSSNFVYVAEAAPSQIETLHQDPATGMLTTAGPVLAVGHGLQTLAVNPTATFAYALANDFVNQTFQNVLLTFSLDASTGLPSLKQILTLGNGIGGSVAVDPLGKFVFASVDTNQASGSGIQVFLIQSDGTVVPNGALMPTDVAPGHIAVDPKDRFLYTTTQVTNKIWGFSINSTTGTLIPLPTTPFTIQRTVPQAGKEPTDLNVLLDPSGQRLFVVDNINARVNAFTVDQTTGALTFQGATTLQQFAELFAPAIDPSGRFLYVAEFNTNGIIGFDVSNTSSAQFPLLPGLPVTTSGAPNRWMVIDRAGNFAYSFEDAAIGDIGKIDAYSINQSTGTLTKVPASPFTLQGSPLWISITP